jgi:hypothetical protein
MTRSVLRVRRLFLDLLPYLARPLLFPFYSSSFFNESRSSRRFRAWRGRRLWRCINRHELGKLSCARTRGLSPILRLDNKKDCLGKDEFSSAIPMDYSAICQKSRIGASLISKMIDCFEND